MGPSPKPPSQAYGRACLNCSRSKCRCVPLDGSWQCERCHRLNKQCVPGSGSRAVGTSSRRSHNSIARIHQLEGKVDELVSLLGTTGGARRTSSGPFFPQHGSAALDDSSSSDPSAAEASDAASATAATGGVPSCMPGAGGVIIALDPAVAGNGARPGESPGPSLVTSLDPGLTDVEAQRYLDDFQANHLPHFPFLHLPDDCRALRAHRPFLFFCIMVAACPSIQRKMEWGDRVKRTLVDRVFLGRHPGVVTIDLLLGALVFLSWGRDYLLMGTPARVPRFAQLAMTLAYDMRLNKPPQEDSEVLPGGGQKTGPGLLPNQNQKSCFGTTRTMEERRAVLACFVTSSVVASYSGQIDIMQWTPHLDECLEIIGQSSECPNDEVLACLVRLQRLAGEVESAKGSVIATSPNFYMSMLKRNVCDLKAKMAPHLREHTVLLLALHYTELSIFSLVPSMKEAPAFQRLECLYSCLDGARRAVDDLLRIPPSEYLGASYLFYVYMARYIVVLWKLSTLNDPNWDTALARATVDVVDVLNRLIDNLGRAAAALPPVPGGAWLDRVSLIFCKTRDFCATKIATNPPVPPVSCQPAPPPPSSSVAASASTSASVDQDPAAGPATPYARFAPIDTGVGPSGVNGEADMAAAAAALDAALWQTDWPADDYTCSFLGENCFI